jgi:phage terminase Nu1 subunit (DNA packaging protein)
MQLDLGRPIQQAQLAQMLGLSEARVSQLMSEGVLPEGGTGMDWLHAYCSRLREQAAGRLGSEVGGLDLAQERAALAREQRMGIALKNAVLRGEYASVSLLGEVLATASQAVAERFDHLPGQLRKACPDLPPAAIDQAMATIASARNEWVRSTAALVSSSLLQDDDENSEQALLDMDDEPRAD